MKLIGMLDSPFVRRSAISFDCLGLSFDHQAISVLRQFKQFSAINPVVKAPTLICDDGTVLMESTLIIDYAQRISTAGRDLMPETGSDLTHAFRRISLALIACEKTAQGFYERDLRPEAKQYSPWKERLEQQLFEAMSALNSETRMDVAPLTDDTLTQQDITTAVTWTFCRDIFPELLTEARFSNLADFTDQAEQLDVFRRYSPD